MHAVKDECSKSGGGSVSVPVTSAPAITSAPVNPGNPGNPAVTNAPGGGAVVTSAPGNPATGGGGGCGRRVCYHTNWSQYRPGAGKFVPEDLDPSLCTHMIYSFAKLTNNHLTAFEWNDEGAGGGYERFTNLKQQNPDLKTMIAVGGWNMGTAGFTSMAASAATRKDFIDDAIKFLRSHNFDGLDLDWEYPANRGSPAGDKHRFTLLVQELRAAFEQEAASTGKERLLLSAAVAAGADKIATAYEVGDLATAVDFINVMTYDFHGGWEATAGHNSPLYAAPGDSGVIANYNIDSAIKYYLSHGAPAQKLNLGLSTYGRNFLLANPSQTATNSPISGNGPAGTFTREAGFNAYYEICDKIKAGATVHRDPNQKVPYAVKGNEWIGYDDEQSLRDKVDYAMGKGLGGVMFWAVDLDDFKGTHCGKGPYPLMHAVKDECSKSGGGGGGPSATSGPSQTISPSNPQTNAPWIPGATNAPWTPAPTDHQVTWWPTNAPWVPGQTNAPWTPAPTNAPWTQAPTSAPLTPAPTHAPITGPTTTHAPHHVDITNEISCDPTKNDFHPNPADCQSYFVCTGGKAYHIDCADGLTFNKASKYCDWPENHECKLPAGAITIGTTKTPPATTAQPAAQPTHAPYNPQTSAPISSGGINPQTICRDQGLADGFHRDPTTCSYFIQCYDNHTVRLKCPPGTGYDDSIHNCDYIGHLSGC